MLLLYRRRCGKNRANDRHIRRSFIKARKKIGEGNLFRFYPPGKIFIIITIRICSTITRFLVVITKRKDIVEYKKYYIEMVEIPFHW